MGWKVKKRPISNGTCSFCGQLIAKSGMRAHLETCNARQKVAEILNKDDRAKSASFFQIAIEGRHAPEYWMHLQIPAHYTLAHLDEFLRDIWLECCGHLSQFIIDDVAYMGQPDESQFFDENEEDFDSLADELPSDASEEVKQMAESFKQFLNTLPEELRDDIMNDVEEQDMNIPLSEVLKPGLKFAHEYDFGSTTELKLVVVSAYEGKIARDDEDPVHVLAHNDAPQIICSHCGKKPATLVSTEPVDGNEIWVCNDCALVYDVELLLPIVNSPRVGVCAYTGDAPDGWDFWVSDSEYYPDNDDDDEFDDEE